MLAPLTVAWTPPARRALRRLPEKVAAAVIESTYGSLSGNPQRVGKTLRFDYDGLHSARRGDFRIIYRINVANRAVEVTAIEHRADVCRRR